MTGLAVNLLLVMIALLLKDTKDEIWKIRKSKEEVEK